MRKPTQRYSAKTRLGRGFTLDEIKGANLNVDFARSIGIMVDHRRTNKSTEQLQLNVNRLKNYLQKLVLLPRKEGKAKRGTCGKLSDCTEKVELVQNTNPDVIDSQQGYKKDKIKVTPAMIKFRPYGHLRLEKMNEKWAGKRAAKANKVEDK